MSKPLPKQLGDITQLTTTNKNDIVSAINEHGSSLADIPKDAVTRSNNTVQKMYSGVATKIICFGDSVTWGQIPTVGGQTANPYPSVLQTRLRTIYNNNNINVVNAGNPGYTSAGLLGVISTQVLTQSPDLVILMCGINDANPINSISQAAYKANMASIIKQILAIGSEVLILSSTPIWQSSSDRLHNLLTYTRIVEDLVKKYAIGFIDLNKEMEKIFLFKRDVPYIAWGGTNIDYVHLADSAYGYISEFIIGKMLSYNSVNNIIPIINSETHIIAVNNNCINTNCTSVTNITSEYSQQHYYLVNDSSTGTYLRFTFFADRDGMDLYLVAPKTKAGGQVTILDNGVAIKTYDSFSNMSSAARYDTEDIILENVQCGLHRIEILTSNIVVGQSQTGVGKIYISEFVFKPTLIPPQDVTYKLAGTTVPVIEKFNKVCNFNGLLRLDGTGVNQAGNLFQQDKTAFLRPTQILVIEAEGTFVNDSGISYFGSKLDSGFGTASFGYLVQLTSTAVNFYVFGDSSKGTALATYATTITFTGSHKIRITHTYAGVITVYLDGVQAFQLTDTREKSGKFGGYMGANGGIVELTRFEYCYR